MASPEKYCKMVSDSTKNLLDFKIINDNIVHLEWENSPGFEEDTLVSSDIHATLVTSYARLVVGVGDKNKPWSVSTAAYSKAY